MPFVEVIVLHILAVRLRPGDRSDRAARVDGLIGVRLYRIYVMLPVLYLVQS